MVFCPSNTPCSTKQTTVSSALLTFLSARSRFFGFTHQSGVAWDDPSGRKLREWLGVTEEEFYDSTTFAVLPNGLCYPGKGKGGDLPPRPECAPQWQAPLLAMMPRLELKILIGAYSQKHYLGKARERTLTATVRNFEAYLPEYFVLPHPSPRNGIFLRRNPWIEADVIPRLRRIVHRIIAQNGGKG